MYMHDCAMAYGAALLKASVYLYIVYTCLVIAKADALFSGEHAWPCVQCALS